VQNLIFGPIWQLKAPFLLGNSNGHAVLFKNLHQNHLIQLDAYPGGA
jgi:hypothetical protein